VKNVQKHHVQVEYFEYIYKVYVLKKVLVCLDIVQNEFLHFS